jgi:hypothetical protein
MREAIITEEWVDDDVCIGDYDSHVTRKTYEVAFFKDGETDPFDRCWYKTELAAQNAANSYERGHYVIGTYGQVELEIC